MVLPRREGGLVHGMVGMHPVAPAHARAFTPPAVVAAGKATPGGSTAAIFRAHTTTGESVASAAALPLRFVVRLAAQNASHRL